MPLIKSDPLSITRDELNALRLRLNEAYQFELINREEQRLLFLRSPRREPDPVTDVEECIERMPDWALTDLHDIFLLGDVGSFHLPATSIRPILERRQRIDATILQHWRDNLDTHYGLGLERVVGDPQNLVRLGVRIPQPRISDLSEADLVRIARVAGPLLASGESPTVRLVYILAEEGHVRMSGDDFFADIQPRWEELQRIPPPPPPTAEEAPLAETLPPPPPRAPRRRPTRVLNVRPAVDFETQADASLNPEYDLSKLSEAETALERLFEERNFRLRRHVAHETVTYAFAAERAAGYPRRVVVKTYARFGRDEAETMLREVRDLDADLVVVVALDADDEARRRTITTKVKVIKPDEVSALSL
ncbi:MAG TPA: hypothetical protein VI818_06240 [Candidatus Thermoplasmatota archaeon]|nr:hypothetical protein [Candidatus Thermoplasmatota archaeon]